MDDFGSGYSSLNMLNRMPLDILKLDMKFIQSETVKPISQGILRFIMSLARWMNLSVVAEGVETGEQLRRLREIGCDYAQGYYFAKPMPLAEFEELFSQRKVHMQGDAHRPGDHWAGQLPQAILVADEDAEYRKQVSATFAGKYQVFQAANGDEALACIANCATQLAAIILSMTLPQTDGESALTMMKREKAVWNIPVIVTAPSDMRRECSAWEQGADDFAGKPHSQASLYQRVLRAVEINTLREREHVLKDEAYRDSMTGLLNRRGLAAAVESLGREDAPMAVYLFDLDDLKHINDNYGHVKGDEMIECFSSVLRSLTRETDILARYGGDEFVAVIRQMSTRETALKKGESICQAVRNTPFTEEFPAACTAGVALCDTGLPLSEMIERADRALYEAKKKRKGGCWLWED